MLVEDLERVTQCPPAQVQLLAQLASRPGGLLGARAARRCKWAAARAGHSSAHLLGQFDVVGEVPLEEPKPAEGAVPELARSGPEEHPAHVDARTDRLLAGEQGLEG